MTFDPETFAAQTNTIFLVSREHEQIPLRLDEVSEARTGRRFVRFSVIFHGPGDRLLEQGTYAFHHDVLGTLDLFIVPVGGTTAERAVYEACFSQPNPATPVQ